MKRLYKTLSIISAVFLCTALAACTEDPTTAGDALQTAPEGECSVEFELQGAPLQTSLTRTAGNAVQNIRNLYILFYTPDGGSESNYKLAYAFTTDRQCANDVFDSEELSITTKSSESREDWSNTAEKATQCVKTSNVHVPRGSYAIYVVANADNFSSAGFSREAVATVGALRNYSLNWNANNIAANDAMFGFFTDSKTEGYDVTEQTAPILDITANARTIHAWVKRAVSKVTVAFDGTQLHDNVRIYIKKVSIHDIPLNCRLGTENSPQSLDELIPNGEQIVYSAVAGATNNTRISSREPYFPNFTGQAEDDAYVARWRGEVHSETANALYFFENRQGMSLSNPGSLDRDPAGDWKQQTDADNNGIPDDRDNGILKDTKTYGTYVEVEAYYQNDNFGSQTEGRIIYRFMLGKNTTNDFNADRNNHYKLTMRFKNNANNVDWHIDYNDQPGIYIPETIYVSYTYNTPTILPIRVVGQNVTSLKVTIDSSNWYPDDSSIPRFTGTTNPTGLATGFLSLTYDENPRIRENEDFNSNDAARVSTYWNNQPNNTTRNYINNGQKVAWADLDAHGYNVMTRTTSEGYTVFEADIPMFTRPLVIYKWTSWTGANPYFSSERTAQITLSGTIDGQSFSRKVTVKQVRRIENPAGIYRRHNNADPFDVTLMARTGEGGSHTAPIAYEPFNSEGAWRAIVYRTTTVNGNNDPWFTLSAGSQTASKVNEFIQGDSDSPISFTYKPNGTIAQNQVRCGIIKVEYNNYTCTHYIFVRQGYAPIQLEAGRVYWHTFNLYSGAEETNNPCEAGSLFIRGRFTPAILDSNTAGFGEVVGTLTAISNEAGTAVSNISIPIANSGTYSRQNFSAASRTLNRNNSTYNPWNTGRVPKLEEWATLLNENANAFVNRAFGVLYSDGVNTTQTSPDDVYGCLHSNISNGNTTRGMRGAFVYNTDNGRNLFFPIGASGYGRRKVGAAGQLQYSFGDTFWSTPLENAARPMIYNLYTNEGALYWGQAQISNKPVTNHSVDNAWDINYKTYDFDYMDSSSTNNTLSACYLRLVQDNPPQ